MTKVKITWKAFGDRPEVGREITSVEFDYDLPEGQEMRFLNLLYEHTNLYQGELWGIISPKLSEHRTHTALSIGDEIQLGDDTYKVAPTGFDLLEKSEV